MFSSASFGEIKTLPKQALFINQKLLDHGTEVTGQMPNYHLYGSLRPHSLCYMTITPIKRRNSRFIDCFLTALYRNVLTSRFIPA